MSKEGTVQGGEGPNATFWTPLFLAWLLALLATAGALFLGEVMGKVRIPRHAGRRSAVMADSIPP